MTAPVANPDSYTTVRGVALTTTKLGLSLPGVLDNDTDGNSDPLTAELDTAPRPA